MKIFLFISCALAVASASVLGPDGHPVETPEVQHARAAHYAAHAKALGHLGYGIPVAHYGVVPGVVSLDGRPLDTPEVAAAKIQHYHDYAVAAQRNAVPVGHALVYNHPVATGHLGVLGAHPIDTPEVQHAKAAHFAAHAEAAARAHGLVHYRRRRSIVAYPQHVPVIDHNGVPVETPEVQAAKAFHLAKHAEVAARSGHYLQAPVNVYAAVHAPQPIAYYNSVSPLAGLALSPRYVYNHAAVVVGPDGHLVDTPEVQQARAEHLAAHAGAHHIYLLFVVTLSGLTTGSGVTIGLHPELHPIHSLYHSQDWRGQYTYGYATPMITRNEVRNMDGTTVGGYSYMDSNGVLQTVQYKSDPIHGFQVAASNLPQDLPDVAAAKAKHLALFRTIQENHAVGAVPQVALPQPVQELPEVVAARAAHMAALEAARSGVMPQPVQDTPEVARAKAEHLAFFEATRVRDEALRRAISLSPTPQGSSSVVAVPNQPSNSADQASVDYRPAANVATHGTNGDLGVYAYGYSGPHSSQMETKSSDGVTRGGYSYIDANGILQTVRYISDDVNGFRVQSTNLLTNPVGARVLNQPQQAPNEEQGTISSNRGGFLINVDNNSIQNDDKALLYTQEIQY
ncbi:uncharacterized protein LOC123314130 [Coccinella septempunctata]|uniref:uncharacterized protein LOC123314130 n=1 Tax=Coccinella septempunctata TaxID=41139 RepID=UPI001D05DF34|nr:uncharacterized protein LOC123314130 [Coccinella septempunctata]